VSDYEAMRRAQEVIAAAEQGDYDERLGITHEQRELLTRAAGDKPLSSADVGHCPRSSATTSSWRHTTPTASPTPRTETDP
jgi:hypothetical protein